MILSHIFIGLVAIQSSIDSHLVEGCCFCHVVQPRPALLVLHTPRYKHQDNYIPWTPMLIISTN